MAELRTPQIKLNGTPVGRSVVIDFIEGAGVTIVAAETPSQEINVTISASGGPGGSGVDVKEDDAGVGTADTIDFGHGIDVTFAGGEAEVTVDESELSVLTAVAFDGNVE